MGKNQRKHAAAAIELFRVPARLMDRQAHYPTASVEAVVLQLIRLLDEQIVSKKDLLQALEQEHQRLVEKMSTIRQELLVSPQRLQVDKGYVWDRVTVDYELPAWFDEMGLAIETLVVDLIAAECRPVRVFNPKDDDRVCVYLPQGRVNTPETDLRFEWRQSQGERYGFKLEIDFNSRWGVNYGLPQLRVKLAVKQVYREQQLAQSVLMLSGVRHELEELQQLQGMAEQSLVGLQQVSGSRCAAGPSRKS
jgi:hypothetical protein